MDGSTINILIIVAAIVITIVRSLNKAKAEKTNQTPEPEDVFKGFEYESKPARVEAPARRKVVDSVEFTPRRREVSKMPDLVSAKEENEYLSEIVNDFDLTRAVIYAEILKPKFEDEQF